MARSFTNERSLPPFRRAANNERVMVDREQEELPASNCFGLAIDGEKAFGFKIHFADGKVSGIYYHDLISPMQFNEAGEIVLLLPSFQIRICGSNLHALFDYFFDYKITWVKEPDASFYTSSGTEPDIESVKIEEVA